MMKKSKIAAVMMTAVMGTALLAGCSGTNGAGNQGATAESVLKEAVNKTKDTTSMTGKMTMDMDIALEIQGFSTSVTANLDADLQSTENVAYIHGPMKMEAMGSTEETEMETYTQKQDDGSWVSYTKMDDEWTKSEVEESQELANAQTFEMMLDKLDKFTLEENTEQVDGSEAYVISGTVDEEMFSEMLSLSGADDMLDTFGGEADADALSKMTIDLKAYFYKDSGYPAKMTMDMTEGMDAVLKDILSGESAAQDESSESAQDNETENADPSAESQEDLDMDVTVNKTVVEFAFTGYDNVESLEVPQEVISAAQEQ